MGEDVPRSVDPRRLTATESGGVHIQGHIRRSMAQPFLHYHVHFTPTSGSWLNLVERLLAELTERCVRRGRRTAVRHLEKAMLDYLDQRNRAPKPFVWRAEADLNPRKVETSLLTIL